MVGWCFESKCVIVIDRNGDLKECPGKIGMKIRNRDGNIKVKNERYLGKLGRVKL